MITYGKQDILFKVVDLMILNHHNRKKDSTNSHAGLDFFTGYDCALEALALSFGCSVKDIQETYRFKQDLYPVQHPLKRE